MLIYRTITLPDELSHERCAVVGVFAMEDESLIRRSGYLLLLLRGEQLVGKDLLVVEVDGAVNVTASELILKTTIDDGGCGYVVGMAAIHDVD